MQSVLERYRRAFSALSAEGVEAFWPGVNKRALNRAFQQLERQSFDFDSCSIAIEGDVARASCSGRASFTPKVGSRVPQIESRRWAFELKRAGDAWTIQSVNSR